MELTLGLPQLPLSNGCMFQGKYPTERRTRLHGHEDLSPKGSTCTGAGMNGGEEGHRTTAACLKSGLLGISDIMGPPP